MKFQFPKIIIPEFLKLKNSSDVVINPATEENQTQMKSLLTEISDLVWVMKSVAYGLTRWPQFEWNTWRMRVSLEWWTWWSININANQTVANVTTVWNVNTLWGTISTVDEAYVINRVSWSQNVWNRIP